jgi:hypothetical protein
MRVPFREEREFFSRSAEKISMKCATFSPRLVFLNLRVSVDLPAVTFVQKVSALHESPAANYILGGIVRSAVAAYSRLHMKGALNFPTYIEQGPARDLCRRLLLASI